MKNVLYIGNALSNSGKTITTIDILGENLKEFCAVYTASKKTNKFLRLLDMIKLVLMKQFKADYVLIDTYSTTNFYYALIISQLCRILSLKYIPILHGGNLPKRLLANPKLCYLIFGNAFDKKIILNQKNLMTDMPLYSWVFVIFANTSLLFL